MAGRTIELHISLSADANMGRALEPAVATARRAQQAVARESARGTAAAAGETRRRLSLDQQVEKARANLNKLAAEESARRTKREGKEFDARLKIAEKAKRERVRLAKEEEDEIVRTGERMARADKKKADAVVAEAKRANAVKERERKKDEREQVASIRRMGSSTINTLGSIGSRALSVGSTIARGMGADLDPASQIGKAQNLNQSAIDITNSGFFAQGKNATAGDVAATKSSIISAGDASKTDYGTVAEGLGKFVSVTGKLEEGKEVIGSIGDLAKASGANFSDLAAAAGEISNALGDVPDKVKLINENLRAMAKSGALGSVEIKDIAEYGARLTGTAKMIGGDRSAAISQMSVLAQSTRAFTKTDAAEATAAAKAFVEDMGNYRNISGKKTGMGSLFGGAEQAKKVIFTDSSNTKMRRPEDIIADVFEKTKGDQSLIAQAFGNKMGRTVVESFGDIYKEKGVAGIHGEFSRLGGSLSEEQVKSAADLAKTGDAANVTAFNNELTKVADAMSAKVLPALEKAAPQLIALAESTAKLVAWAASNPGAAITLAIAASIGKAAIGEVLSKGIEKLMGGAFGKGAAALTVGFASFEITKAVINTVLEDKDAGTTARVMGDIDISNKEHAARVAAKEGRNDEAIKQADEALKAIRERRANVDEVNKIGPGQGVGQGLIGMVNPEWGTSFARQQQGNEDASPVGKGNLAIAEALANLTKAGAQLAQIHSIPINVTATVTQGAPTVDSTARNDGKGT